MRILFAQPRMESGIAGNVFCPPAARKPPPTDQWLLALWQPNPLTADGQMVPTGWTAGAVTGFSPHNPLNAQVGFSPVGSRTTAQMEHGIVGAYINSYDLPGSPPNSKMMIDPQYEWSTANQFAPFASTEELSWSLDLQVPAASGHDTYITAGAQFLSSNGVLLDIGVKLFTNGAREFASGIDYDSSSDSYLVNLPLSPDETAITSHAAVSTGQIWTGWRRFAWSLSYTQMMELIIAVAHAYPQLQLPETPTTYALKKIHLDAEFHFSPAPADLGWSMKNYVLSAD